MRIAIIGGGPGGYVAAIRAAQLGAEAVLIEKNRLGGACLHVGCIPTKCLLHTAALLEALRWEGPEIGVSAAAAQVEFPQVMKHKREVSEKLAAGIAGLLRSNGVQRVEGEASFSAPGRLVVKKRDGAVEAVPADAVIVAVGSVNAVPPIPGIAGNPDCIDSTGALNLDAPPKSMAVIGGGVVGLELACAYAAFGTKITVVEAMGRMLPMLDSDLTQIGAAHMKRMGISFHLNSPVQSVARCPGGVRVVCKEKSGETRCFEAEKVLTAVGRKANTATLNLEAGGIAHDRGAIRVNDKMETNVAGVYAVGDCVLGRAQLAHTASAMGETAVENICGREAHYRETSNPTCVYIMPEAASVGLTEEQCRARGLGYRVGKFPLSANGRALIVNGGEGMVKLIAGDRYGEILGLHVIGPGASDLIAEGALAIEAECTVDELIRTIHSHPTVNESIREAALASRGRAIHIPNETVKKGKEAHGWTS